MSNKTLISPTITGSSTFKGNINASGQQITCEYINATNNVGIGQNYDGNNMFTVAGADESDTNEPSLSVNRGTVAIRAKASDQGEALYVNGTSLLSDTTVEGDLIMKYNYNDISANGQLKVGENATFYRNVFIPSYTSLETTDPNNPSFIAQHTNTHWSLSRKLSDLENTELQPGSGIKIENTIPNSTISLDENADVNFNISANEHNTSQVNFNLTNSEGTTNRIYSDSQHLIIEAGEPKTSGSGGNVVLKAGDRRDITNINNKIGSVVLGGYGGLCVGNASYTATYDTFKNDINSPHDGAYIKPISCFHKIKYYYAHDKVNFIVADFQVYPGSILYLSLETRSAQATQADSITICNYHGLTGFPLQDRPIINGYTAGVPISLSTGTKVLYNSISKSSSWTGGSLLVLMYLGNVWKEILYVE